MPVEMWIFYYFSDKILEEFVVRYALAHLCMRPRRDFTDYFAILKCQVIKLICSFYTI